MSIFDSLKVSLFGITIVFIVLVTLSFLVKIQSIVINSMFRKKEQAPNTENGYGVECEKVREASNGELKLIGVDDKTAAIIMAIVSDETKIPLSELQFKSIKALD